MENLDWQLPDGLDPTTDSITGVTVLCYLYWTSPSFSFIAPPLPLSFLCFHFWCSTYVFWSPGLDLCLCSHLRDRGLWVCPYLVWLRPLPGLWLRACLPPSLKSLFTYLLGVSGSFPLTSPSQTDCLLSSHSYFTFVLLGTASIVRELSVAGVVTEKENDTDMAKDETADEPGKQPKGCVVHQT